MDLYSVPSEGEPGTPGVIDRMQDVLVELGRSRNESNATLQLLFEVCSNQKDSIASVTEEVTALRKDLNFVAGSVRNLDEKLDGLIAVNSGDALSTVMNTALNALAGKLDSFIHRMQTTTHGTDTAAAAAASASSLPPLIDTADLISWDTPPTNTLASSVQRISVEQVMQSAQAQSAPAAMAPHTTPNLDASPQAAEAAQRLTELGVTSQSAIQTLTSMLEAADKEADVSKRLRQAETWAKRLLTDSLKFEVGVTDVGEWLASAEAAAAMFEVYIARMAGIVDAAWVHDRILELIPSDFRVRLSATQSSERTPWTLLTLAQQTFQDRHAELTNALVAPRLAATYKQAPSQTFTRHLDQCVRLYRTYFVREKLTPARYVERFGPTHRLGPLSTVFQTAVRKHLEHMNIAESSDRYRFGDLEPIRTVCRTLDREEEERVHVAPESLPSTRAAAALDAPNTAPSTGRSTFGSDFGRDFGRDFDPNPGRGWHADRGNRGGRFPWGRHNRGGRGGRGYQAQPPADVDLLGDVVAGNPNASVNTNALHAPGISSHVVAAVHSGALRAGRSPAMSVEAHAEFLSASLGPAPVHPEVNATTRSRNTVQFSDSVDQRTFDPDTPPSEVKQARENAVPVHDTGPDGDQPSASSTLDATQPASGVSEQDANAHTPVPATQDASNAKTSSPAPATPAADGRSKRKKRSAAARRQRKASASDPMPATQNDSERGRHPAGPASSPPSGTGRRPVLQADRGDICDEQDSDKLTRRREQLEQFRQQAQAKNVPQRVYRAILHSTVTLTLSELAAVAMHEELVTLLVQLADTLRGEVDEAALRGPRATVDALLAATLKRIVLNDARVPAAETSAMLAAACTACAERSAHDTEWSAAMCASAEWRAVPGKTSTFDVGFSHMRKCLGFLTSDVQPPLKNSPRAVRVAFDEGAEMNTITLDAWERHRADWEKGHAPFSARDDIGPTHGVRMENTVNLRSFHGEISKFNHMVLIHLRLGCAVYPVYCTVVNGAPADVVLGLAFRRKHDAAFPVGYPVRQGDGVTLMCLGVPPGYGLYFPQAIRSRYAGRDPAQTIYRQVLRLDTSWRVWHVTGKRLTSAQLADDLGSPAP